MRKVRRRRQEKHGRNTHAQSEREEEWTLNSIQTIVGRRTTTQNVGGINSKQKSWIKTTAMTHTSRNRALEAILPVRYMHKTTGEPRLVREEEQNASLCEDPSLCARINQPM